MKGRVLKNPELVTRGKVAIQKGSRWGQKKKADRRELVRAGDGGECPTQERLRGPEQGVAKTGLGGP